MLRANTDQPVKFIYSKAAAATVKGAPNTWILCEGDKAGTLSLIRFKADSTPLKLTTVFLTNNGWKLDRKNNKPVPTVSAKLISDIPLYPAHVLNLIRKKFPELALENLKLPDSDEQTSLACYATYHLPHVRQEIVPVTNGQCFDKHNKESVKPLNSISILKRPSSLFFSKTLAQEPKATSTETVEKELGFIWTETNVIRPYHIREIKVRMQSAKAIKLTDEQYLLLSYKLEANRNKIGISYAGNEMGYIVVAMEDLPANTLLTTYTGELRPRSDVLLDKCLNSRYAMTYDCKASEMLFALDAAQYRNFGAMISHLPKAADIAKYAFRIGNIDINPEDGKPDIATENVRILKYTYQHFPFAIIETSAAVKKGEILGFDYEINYWLALGVTPSLFTRKAKQLNPQHYRADTITVVVKNNTKELRTVVEATLQTFLNQFQNNNGYYLLSVNGQEQAISGAEFQMKFKQHPHALVMEVTDCIDEYKAAYRNTFGQRK